MMHKIFFGLISLALVVTAGFQLFIGEELRKECGHELMLAPVASGVCLLLSFLFNFLWLRTRGSKRLWLKRAAIFSWTAVITLGVAAAGAALGQAQVYDRACPALTSTTNFDVLGAMSILLLVFSVAAPHAYAKKNKKEDKKELPLTSSEPLRFL